MPLKKISFSDMNRTSQRYLANNTDITYFSQGSVAKALVEATNLEISRLQDFVGTVFDNGFLSTANGVYLDLFGEMLGVPRISDRRAETSVQDGSVRFYTDSGTLGSRLPDPANAARGLVPAGTTVTNSENTITFTVTTDVSFPINTRSVFVPVQANDTGANYNVGANQLNSHSLGLTEIKVTNDLSITTGTDVEPDSEYRFRLSKAMTTRFGSNAAAVKVAASVHPGISRVDLIPYARGSGTFDVLLVPQGNRLQQSIKEDVRRSVESVVAFGISPRVVEPEYLRFCIVVQLKYTDGTVEGERASARGASESAILRYLGSIPIGGELIINQLRAAVLNSSSFMKDMKIIEMCINGNPRIISNIQLSSNEIIVPDQEAEDAVSVF